MGIASAQISLDNPRLASSPSVEVQALVDTGSAFLCIPEQVADQLQLHRGEIQKEVSTADGRRTTYPYVGPVHVSFEDRECYVGALVLGDEVLLGALPMEDMDLVVLTQERRVAANPFHPKFAGTAVKSISTP